MHKLDPLWNDVVACLERASNIRAGEDDLYMKTASADELRQWCDDLADRVGYDVTEMRAAVDAYIAERERVMTEALPHANGCAMPYRNPAQWRAMFERVQAAGADGVVGHYNGHLLLTLAGRFIGTIPMEPADAEVWAQ